jgi:pSer/pThr/pTyr-binding forkhead associated (FHA) protein
MEARRRGPRRLLVHVAHTWVPLPVGEWVIGRAPESDIRIDDDRVSRRHAVVRASADGWEVSDGGSLNGIWLDGKQVQRVTVPPGGVTVRFGGKDGVAVRLQPDGVTAAPESSGRPDIDHPFGAEAPAPMTSPVGVRFEEVTPGWTGWASPEPAERSRLKALMRRVGAKRTAGPGDPGPAEDGS